MHRDNRGYYYRSQRVGNTVTRQYLGKDALRSSTAKAETRDHKKREQLRQRNQKALACLDEDEAQTKLLHQFVSLVMRNRLETAGYRQHARGQWRKRRKTQVEHEEIVMTKNICKASNGLDNQSSSLAKEASEPSTDRESLLNQLDKMAKDPDQTREFLSLLKGGAGELSLLNAFADVGRSSRNKIIERMDKQPLFRQSCVRKIELMREELSGPAPSSLESLLIERILNNWLQVHHLEMLVNVQESVQWIKVYEERFDKAHKRYVASIKTLAQVRKLQLPNVQVNIAEKQVNVGQMNVGGE